MTSPIRSIVVFCILFLISFAVSKGADKTFERTFAAKAGGTLVISTDVGNVNIEGTGGNSVSIHVLISGRQKDVDDFSVEAKETVSGVEVTGKTTRGKRWWNWSSDDFEVTYTIKVPREYNGALKTAGGNVTVKNLTGKLSGGTSGGNINLTSITGGVDLETSGGDIKVEKAEGSLRLQTSGGNIRITDVRGDVDVETSGGNIALASIEGKIRAETSGGNIVMTVREKNNGVHAETSGGNIDIQLPKNIAATVDASTSGGDVTCDFPITMSGKLDSSRIRGTINGGGNKVYAHTSGGNIRIRSVE